MQRGMDGLTVRGELTRHSLDDSVDPAEGHGFTLVAAAREYEQIRLGGELAHEALHQHRLADPGFALNPNDRASAVFRPGKCFSQALVLWFSRHEGVARKMDARAKARA